MSDACRFEADVLDAVANDAWTEPLRRHVAVCADCAAAAEVGPWMQQFARTDEIRRPLPDPAVLFLKAKLMQTRTAADRATQPITRLQIAAYLLVAAGWATLITWKRTALMAWVQTLDPGHVVVSGTATAPLSMAVLFTAFALLSITAALAFHTAFAEE